MFGVLLGLFEIADHFPEVSNLRSFLSKQLILCAADNAGHLIMLGDALC